MGPEKRRVNFALTREAENVLSGTGKKEGELRADTRSRERTMRDGKKGRENFALTREEENVLSGTGRERTGTNYAGREGRERTGNQEWLERSSFRSDRVRV